MLEGNLSITQVWPVGGGVVGRDGEVLGFVWVRGVDYLGEDEGTLRNLRARLPSSTSAYSSVPRLGAMKYRCYVANAELIACNDPGRLHQ